MSYWIVLLIGIIVISLFQKTRRNEEHFLNWIREAIKVNQDFNNMVFTNVANYNGIAKDWIPNMSWIYTLKDKGIEKTRAERGLPPMIASQPNIKMDLSNNINRYSVGFKP